MFSDATVVWFARDIYADRGITYEEGAWPYYVDALVNVGLVRFIARVGLAGCRAAFSRSEGIIYVADDARASRISWLVAHEVAEMYLGGGCHDGVERDCNALADELVTPSLAELSSGVYAIVPRAASSSPEDVRTLAERLQA